MAHRRHRGRRQIIGAVVLSLLAWAAFQTDALGSPSAATPSSSAVIDLGSATGWKVLISATATQTGAQISTPGFSTAGWLTVANDGGGAPGTEINALLQNNTCPN